MKKLVCFIILLFFVKFTFAQFFAQVPQSVKYKAEKVIDPEFGITMYEKINFDIGGDSLRNDSKGYASQGWIEDFYEDGKVLHKGYYEDGHLKAYKNYFPNGTLERSFKVVDFKRCNMQIFYSDGKLKSEITYYGGNPQIWTDYFPNGQIEFIEESTKSMEFLIQRKSFSQDGKPLEIFEMTDPKKKIYIKKEYYENGNIKTEGQMKYNPGAMDYQKDGEWKLYNESGSVTTEKWVKGEEIK
jgi:antitoxin component YwqK of YwqJK toxin-antitoxin module